jgi:two-component system cell cycle response regulator DivK
MSLILLVEDDPDSREIYRTILEHHGYQVIETRDGQTGVAAARSRHPDLVLMDISMPVMSGWDAARLLKGDPVTASIPIAALTAHVLEPDSRMASDSCFDAFITKPAHPSAVLEVVRRLLSERAG